MTHGSLFSGIGGFDVAAQWMGWQNVFHCEIDPFCRRVLQYYWPQAITYDDITKTDFAIHRGRIDVISGGFPCQPFSTAGKRKGTADPRNLWPQMLRAVREIKPSWIVAENVRGLTNWNRGMVFRQVLTDLEDSGYQVQSFLLPAAGVGAPHRRDRIWIIAHCEGLRDRRNTGAMEHTEGEPKEQNDGAEPYSSGKNGPSSHTGSDGHELRRPGEDRQAPGHSEGQGLQRQRVRPDVGRVGQQEVAADATGLRLQFSQDARKMGERQTKMERERSKPSLPAETDGGEQVTADATTIGTQGHGPVGERQSQAQAGQGLPRCDSPGDYWQQWPTEPPLCGRTHGLSAQLDGITVSKLRRESIKAYGNAIVPQVVYEIFKAIANADS